MGGGGGGGDEYLHLEQGQTRWKEHGELGGMWPEEIDLANSW